MAQIYLNPLTDTGFKIIFRKKRNMVALLESILDRKIEDLDYIDTEVLGVTIDETNSRFDLAVRFQDGSNCVVEMQRAFLFYFNYRSVFYASHLVQMQANREHDRQFAELKKRGKQTFWNYYFCPVYFVGILENGWGPMPMKDTEGPVLERYRLIEKSTGVDMNVEYNFIYLRLDRFCKRESECETLLDEFAYMFKHTYKEQKRPESFRDEDIMNVYDDALLANFTPEIAHELIISSKMTTENDWLVAMNEAEARATKIGFDLGIQQGIQQGIEAKARQTAINMKSAGIPLDVIASCTGLTLEQVTAL